MSAAAQPCCLRISRFSSRAQSCRDAMSSIWQSVSTQSVKHMKNLNGLDPEVGCCDGKPGFQTVSKEHSFSVAQVNSHIVPSR